MQKSLVGEARSHPAAPAHGCIFGALVAGAVLLAGLCGCGTGPSEVTAAQAVTSASTPGAVSAVAAVDQRRTAAPAVLSVTSPSTTKTFTVEDLAAFDRVEGYGGFTCPPHPGITGPTRYAGVALLDLLEAAGGIDARSVVSVAASDNYVMTFSADQIRNGGFTIYDPSSGAESTAKSIPQPVIAYEREGLALSEDEGSLRLVFLTPEPEQLVEGFLWVKWVTRVQVRSRNDDWTLRLDGNESTTLDRMSFEQLAVPSGNRVSWEDIQGRIWSGVPLSLLVGLVDDSGGGPVPGLDSVKASLGYQIEIVGGDGASVTVKSTDLEKGTAFVVANVMEGNPLGDLEFPLRLVGDGLKPSQFVDGVREIRVHVP